MQRSDKAISGFAHQKPARAAGEKDGFRPDIEGLRGVAVSLVVLFHAGLLSASPLQLTGGFIGVDLFFVVSGYLITGLLMRERERTGRISFSRFYARRVRRILPAAAVTLLITIPLANALVTLVDRPSVMEDGASAALSIANIRFAITTDYFNPVNYSPFLHFWSLGVEEQFYFVWPALLLVVAWKWPRLGAGAALAVIVVASFIASLALTETSASVAFYMLPTRAWQLGAGGLLAVGAGSLDRLPAAIRGVWQQVLAFAGWAALAALITAAIAISSVATPYPGYAAIVPTLAGVLLIASGPISTGPGILLRLAPIRFLGKISYSLYLWHWPTLILGGLFLTGPLGTLSPVQALVLAGLSIPVATASWFFVEEPFRRGTIPLPRPSRIVAVGVAVMLLVAVVGTSFDFGAQSALAALGDGPTPSPAATTTVGPTATPVPTLTSAPVSIPPGDTPHSHAHAGYDARPDASSEFGTPDVICDQQQHPAFARQGRDRLRAALARQLSGLAGDDQPEHREQVHLWQPGRCLHSRPRRRFARLGPVPGRERRGQGSRLEAERVPQDRLLVPGLERSDVVRAADGSIPAVRDLEQRRHRQAPEEPT